MSTSTETNQSQPTYTMFLRRRSLVILLLPAIGYTFVIYSLIGRTCDEGAESMFGEDYSVYNEDAVRREDIVRRDSPRELLMENREEIIVPAPFSRRRTAQRLQQQQRQQRRRQERPSTFSDASFDPYSRYSPRHPFNCTNIPDIKLKKKIGHGVSKQTFLGEYRGHSLAVKMVTRHIHDVKTCLDALKARDDRGANTEGTEAANKMAAARQRCYTPSTLKLMKEILLAEQLDHPNIARLLGYCVRSEESDSTDIAEHGVVSVYELGSRFVVDSLQILPWPQRLRHALDMAHLLLYLEHSPLGSLVIPDFKEGHFVLVNSTLKLIDLDDINNIEPSCGAAVKVFVRREEGGVVEGGEGGGEGVEGGEGGIGEGLRGRGNAGRRRERGGREGELRGRDRDRKQREFGEGRVHERREAESGLMKTKQIRELGTADAHGQHHPPSPPSAPPFSQHPRPSMHRGTGQVKPQVRHSENPTLPENPGFQRPSEQLASLTLEQPDTVRLLVAENLGSYRRLSKTPDSGRALSENPGTERRSESMRLSENPESLSENQGSHQRLSENPDTERLSENPDTERLSENQGSHQRLSENPASHQRLSANPDTERLSENPGSHQRLSENADAERLSENQGSHQKLSENADTERLSENPGSHQRLSENADTEILSENQVSHQRLSENPGSLSLSLSDSFYSSSECEFNVPCSRALCVGFNAKYNLQNMNRLLFKRLLFPLTFPQHVVGEVGQINAMLDTLDLSASQLRTRLLIVEQRAYNQKSVPTR